jgi:predicted CoA-binding protein
MKPIIAIIGASTNRAKYGNRAVRAYARQGWEIYPIHPHAADIEGHRAYSSILEVPVQPLDRVSFYVPPEVGRTLIDDVARKGAREVWFNPGSESEELLRRARELGLNPIVACSIIAIHEDPSQ